MSPVENGMEVPEKKTPIEETVVQEDAVVDAPVATPKTPRKAAAKAKAKSKTAPKKAASKRASKPKARVRKRPAADKPVDTPPVEPAPAVYTLEELKGQGKEVKDEIVSAVVEPLIDMAGSFSQTVRDTVGGALAGLLSRRRRD